MAKQYVNPLDHETIKLDLSAFMPPILMTSTPYTDATQSTSDPPHANLPLMALLVVDTFHTLANSVTRNLLRRVIRNQRGAQTANEVPSKASGRMSYKTARGIPNYGQTCFLNSILQSLASLEPFLLYLDRLQKVSGEDNSSSSIANSLSLLLQTINGQREGRVDPRFLLKTIGKKHAQFRSTAREQQDAHELLQALIDLLVETENVSAVSAGDSVVSLSTFLIEVEKEKRLVHEDEAHRREFISGHNKHLDSTFATINRGEEKKQDETAVDSAPGMKVTANEEIDKYYDRLDSLMMDSEPSPDDERGGSMFESISATTPSPLNGWMGSTLQCVQCQHVRPIQNAPFLDIGIVPTSVSKYINEGCYSNQPSKNSPASRFPSCTLAECLDNYTEVERVKGVECRQCTIKKELDFWEGEVSLLQGAIHSLKVRAKLEPDSAVQADLLAAEGHLNLLRTIDPNEVDVIPAGPTSMSGVDKTENVVLYRGDALKCLLLTRLPTIICIHVQRRYYDPRLNNMAKTIQHIEFDQVMDFGRYSAYCGDDKGMTGKRDGRKQRTTPVLYRLVSVVEHSGNAFSGHYVAYRRDLANPGGWVFVSDEHVKSVPWNEVKSRQAYMLFYEKM